MLHEMDRREFDYRCVPGKDVLEVLGSMEEDIGRLYRAEVQYLRYDAKERRLIFLVGDSSPRFHQNRKIGPVSAEDAARIMAASDGKIVPVLEADDKEPVYGVAATPLLKMPEEACLADVVIEGGNDGR